MGLYLVAEPALASELRRHRPQSSRRATWHWAARAPEVEPRHEELFEALMRFVRTVRSSFSVEQPGFFIFITH